MVMSPCFLLRLVSLVDCIFLVVAIAIVIIVFLRRLLLPLDQAGGRDGRGNTKDDGIFRKLDTKAAPTAKGLDVTIMKVDDGLC